MEKKPQTILIKKRNDKDNRTICLNSKSNVCENGAKIHFHFVGQKNDDVYKWALVSCQCSAWPPLCKQIHRWTTEKKSNTFYSRMKSYNLHLCFICIGFMMNAPACDSFRGLSDRATAFITKSDQTLSFDTHNYAVILNENTASTQVNSIKMAFGRLENCACVWTRFSMWRSQSVWHSSTTV